MLCSSFCEIFLLNILNLVLFCFRVLYKKYLHGDVVAYGVLVQLAVDQDMERLKEVKRFMQQLGILSTLKEMGVPLDREYLKEVLKETVTGPDMEHIPYAVTEDMIFEGMKVVEELG